MPIVTQFITSTETVYEHLASMLESAMHTVIQRNDLEELHLNESDRKIVMTQSVENYLNFDAKTIDASVIDSDPEHFITNVVKLFNQSCIEGLNLNVSSIEESRPDKEEVSGQLKMLMIGYYFGVLKDADFDTSIEVDWKWNQIQNQMKQLMMTKLQSIMTSIQQMFHAEIAQRAQDFTASFKVVHKQVVVILKSFKAYASQILISQLRSFYFSLVFSTEGLDRQKMKETFQRTVDMWMVAYKLCERDCEPHMFAQLLPDFLEDMLLTRIKHNDKIVDDPIVKTFWVKFMSFLYQFNFKNNSTQENHDLINHNERYAMFIYRIFFSKEKLKANDKLSEFLHVIYKNYGMNYLYPTAELRDSNPAEFSRRVELNQRFIVDLILFLDFPVIEEDKEYSVEMNRKLEISFSDEEVLTLVNGAPVWFAFDLRKLNSEDIILNWFVDLNSQNAIDDYTLMYETLMEFRRTYRGDSPGEDLDVWLGTYLVDPVDFVPEEINADWREEPKRVHNLSQYWLMKSINMINILNGSEYDETFTNAYLPETNDDIIMFFRRIVNREEFAFLKKAMLRIFAYYSEDNKVYTTDIEDDKFIYEVYEMSIECEKLPEILGTEVNITTITIKDDEEDTLNKKKLDNGSETTEEIIVVNESESSSELSESPKNEVRSASNNTSYKTAPNMKSDVTNSQVQKSEKTHEEVIEVTSSNNSETTQKEVIEISSSNSSNKTTEEIIEVTSSSSSKKTTEVIVESSDNTSEVHEVVVVSTKTSHVSDNESEASEHMNRPNVNPTIIPVIIDKKTSEKNSSESSNDEDVLPTIKKTSPTNKTSMKTTESNLHERTPVHISSENSNVEVIETESSNTSVDLDEDSKNQKSTKSSTSKIVVNDKSHETQEDVSETSSHETSNKNDSESESSPGITIDENNRFKKKDKESENSLDTDKSDPVRKEEKSPLKSAASDSNGSWNIVGEKKKKKSEHSSETSSYKSWVEPVRSTKTSHKTEDKTIEIVEEISSHNSEQEQSEHSKSVKKSNKTSPKVDTSIYSEIESDIKTHPVQESSYSSEDTDHDQLDEVRSTSPKVIVKESSSNSSESHKDSNKTGGNNHPLSKDESSHSSESNEEVVIQKDVDEKRKNLVYEVTGRLTPEQRKTFEFSDDVIASVKDMKVQVDEYGNETEFVYVQIVRKDSDCYQELLNYVNL
jgi:hypothetical protein